jgi:ABC-2 type transport system permease protein
VIFGYIIATLLGFIVGSLALYLTDIYGINVSLMWLTTIIGGGMLPLAFFPQNMQHILLMLPFAFLAYVPAGTLVGMLSASTAVSLLPIGVVWIAAFAVIAYFMWKRMSVRMNAVYI